MYLIPKGKYKAQLVPVETDYGPAKVQFGRSPKKGTEQVVVQFRILEGEEMGATLSWTGYFIDSTTEKTIKALRACGFKGDDLSTINDQPLDETVEIVVEHEEYEGKIYPRIRWVNRPGEGGSGGLKLANPMVGKDLRLFAARMKASVMQVPAAASDAKPNGGAPAKPWTKPAAGNQGGLAREPGGDDDDIAF